MPASSLSAAQAVDFYSDLAGLPRPVKSRPEGSCREFGCAALVQGVLVGLLAGELKGDNGRPGDALVFLNGGVHGAWRRRGIGRALIEALGEQCQDMGRRTTAVLNLDTHRPVPAPFLAKTGFDETVGSVCYRRNLGGIAPSPSSTAFETRDYRGGDAALDDAIVDIYRRAYRGRSRVPELSIEMLWADFIDRACSYHLVFDSDLLVGHASVRFMKRDCLVESIQVSRSHWATGAGDALALSILRQAFECDAECIVGAADATNWANRALMERHGLQPVGVIRRFCRVFT